MTRRLSDGVPKAALNQKPKGECAYRFQSRRCGIKERVCMVAAPSICNYILLFSSLGGHC